MFCQLGLLWANGILSLSFLCLVCCRFPLAIELLLKSLGSSDLSLLHWFRTTWGFLFNIEGFCSQVLERWCFQFRAIWSIGTRSCFSIVSCIEPLGIISTGKVLNPGFTLAFPNIRVVLSYSRRTTPDSTIRMNSIFFRKTNAPSQNSARDGSLYLLCGQGSLPVSQTGTPRSNDLNINAIL